MNDAASQPPSSTSLPIKRRASEHNRGTSTARNAPTTFFFLTEEQVQRSAATTAESPVSAESSTYGVQSLESTVLSAEKTDLPPAVESNDLASSSELQQSQSSKATITPDHFKSERPITPSFQLRHPALRRTASHSSDGSSPGRPLPSHSSLTALTGRTTPLYLYSPAGDTDSAPTGTPKSVSLRSLRLSDDESAAESVADDTGSQAITSGDEEEDNPASASYAQDAPQLVMPNLRLPSRRPFTQRGKDIGKLKIMIAGAKGVGKTSLIKSIVQVCEDIVHIDPINLSTPSLRTSELRFAKKQHGTLASSQSSSPAEILASTRAYPTWWSDLEENGMLRRRQSLGEQVLERNIVFLDAPGLDHESVHSHASDPVLQHVEACLRRNLDFDLLSEGEILSILSGGGGVQVDLAIYMFTDNPTHRDIENLRRLSLHTHIVPVIAKADLLVPEQIQELESSIANDLNAAGIQIPNLDTVAHPNPSLSPKSPIWSVSSAPGSDIENMDASLLMSPDYVQPLIPTDLSEMVRRIFDPETAAWLRHSGAKKFLRWRNSSAPAVRKDVFTDNSLSKSRQIPSPLGAVSSISSFSSDPASQSHRPSTTNTTALNQLHLDIPATTYSTARVADHTQREERRAQARLAWWAADLQRSLANERARFEQLHHQERKGWLLDRFSELSEADQLTAPASTHLRPTTSRQPSTLRVKHQPYPQHTSVNAYYPDPHDPLGLLALDSHIRRNGLAVVKVLGGAGVLGAMVVWVLRHWSRELGFSDDSPTSSFWPFEWGAGSGCNGC